MQWESEARATLAQERVARQVFWRRRGFRRHIVGYLLISPWLIGFLVFTAGPMIASVVLSLMEWEILLPPKWTGLANYGRLATDELVRIALYNTAYYTFIAVPLHVAGALALAMLLNANVRARSFYRTVFYLPSVTPAVASAVLWLWIFNPEFGLINVLLRLVGLSSQNWLQSDELVKPAFIIMSMWGLGGPMIIFLASLQGVPTRLYEAAELDGAGARARFLHITLPMISPVIFFNLIIDIIGSFQVFTSAYLMTNGGPHNASLFYVLYLYRNAFVYFRMGYASALAWLIFVIIMVFTVLQFLLANRWVYYETEGRRN